MNSIVYFSSSIEDIIKRNGSEIKNLRLLEQIKGLIYRINRRTYKYSYLSRSPIEKLNRLVSNGKISEIITELTVLEGKNPPHNSSMSSEYEPCDTELPENIAALKTALEKIPDKEQTFKNFAETTVREFDTSKVVVYEIHDPRLSYILNYDAKDNATIDEFKPNLIESSDILNRLKDPSTRKQFRKEHHLSPKALISILEQDLFVAKNRVALHLVEALSNIIWNMYEDSTSYETKNQKSETASISSRNAGGGKTYSIVENAIKTGYLLGIGRNAIYKDPLLHSIKTINPTAKIVMKTANTLVNGYLNEFTTTKAEGMPTSSTDSSMHLDYSEADYQKIKEIGATQAAVIKNYWINRYKGIEPLKDETDKSGKQRKYVGFLENGARIQETGWCQNNSRDHTCALNTHFLYYVKNKQFPGILWLNATAEEGLLLKKANVEATDESTFVKEKSSKLEEPEFKDIVSLRNKNRITRPVLNATFNLLGASIMEFPSKYCNFDSPTINEKVSESTQINTIASYFPYNPIITSIETRGRGGHYGYQRNSCKLDQNRIEAGDISWFSPNFETLYPDFYQSQNKEPSDPKKWSDDFFMNPSNTYWDSSSGKIDYNSNIWSSIRFGNLSMPSIYSGKSLEKTGEYYLKPPQKN